MNNLHCLKYLAFVLSATVVLSGCLSVGPDYKKPELAELNAWHAQLSEGLATGQADLQTWWKSFDDPILDSLGQFDDFGIHARQVLYNDQFGNEAIPQEEI